MTTRQHNGCGSVRRRGNVFWIRYYQRGRRIEESSHSSKRRDAEQLLKSRIAEIQSGRFVGRNAERVTFENYALELRAV